MGNTLTATLRAVDYLRVSTEEQAKGYGISYSGKKTARFIERKGWSHLDTFTDEGVSGSLSWQERDDLPRLMALAQQTPRPFDVVVVSETRAIGRKDRAFWRWVWELEDLGIFVAVVDKDIDNTTDAGRDAMREEANYSFKEYGRIRSRTQSGIQEKAEGGGWPGGVPPYGWYIKDQGKKGESTPAVEDAEAAICHRMRELRVARKSYSQMAIVLRAEEKVTRTGLDWTEESVRRTLTSEALLEGRVIFRSPRRAKHSEDGTPVYGPMVVIPLPPIFMAEQVAELQAVQESMAGVRGPQEEAGIYTASGRLIGPCGAKHTGYARRSRGVRMYRCSGESTSECSQIDADLLEEHLWTRIEKLLGDPEQLRAMARDWTVLAAKTRVDFAKRIEALDREIEEQNDAIDVTMTVAAKRAAQRKLSREAAEQAVERAVMPLEDELARLEKERAQLVEWQAESDAAHARVNDLKRLAEVARERLHPLSPAQQREVFALLGLELTIKGPTPKRPAPGSPTAWFYDRKRMVPTLSDDAWAKAQAVIERLDSGRGPERLPARPVLEGILFKAATGAKWDELPPECGKPASVRQRWNRWVKSGAWDQIMDILKDAPGVPPCVLPKIEMRGTLDPRSLIGHMAAPEGSVPVEPRTQGAIQFHMHLAA